MSLIGAAIIPHNPLLVPGIGLQYQTDFATTIFGINKILDYISSKSVDSLIIVNGHNNLIVDSFIINLCPEYQINFEKFGDLNTKFSFPGNTGFSYRLKESTETQLPLSLVGEQFFDYGLGVVLNFLQSRNLRLPCTSLYTAPQLNQQMHIDFGQSLMTLLHHETKKFFVIASGNLTHTMLDSAADREKSKEFDSLFIKTVKTKNEIKTFDQNLLTSVKQCIHYPWLVLAGMLKEINYFPEIFSYENKHGVGMLTALFKL